MTGGGAKRAGYVSKWWLGKKAFKIKLGKGAARNIGVGENHF